MPKKSCLVIPLFLIFIGTRANAAHSKTTTATLEAGQELDKVTLSALSKTAEAKFSPTGISKSLNYVLYRNNIFIPVSVNASEPCLFWVDTGGGTSFINSRHKSFELLKSSSALYHVLNLEQSGKLIKDYLELYQMGSLTFAGIELSGTIMQFMKSDDFDQTIFTETGLEVCGMLGTTALSAFITQIDYPKNTITFYSDQNEELRKSLDGANKAKYRADPAEGNIAYVGMDINNKELRFAFDTGASYPMRLTESTIRDLNLPGTSGYYQIEKAGLGDMVFKNIQAKKREGSFNVIGYGLFRDSKITLDYRQGYVYFQ